MGIGVSVSRGGAVKLTPERRAALEYLSDRPAKDGRWVLVRDFYASEFASLSKSGHAEAHILSANTALCRITPAGKQALKDNT